MVLVFGGAAMPLIVYTCSLSFPVVRRDRKHASSILLRCVMPCNPRPFMVSSPPMSMLASYSRPVEHAIASRHLSLVSLNRLASRPSVNASSES
jgi:hypothetical protein